MYVRTRVPSCNARKRMKRPERRTCNEPLDGTFENPFWWKHSDGAGCQNHLKETTRKNYHDLRSKQAQANQHWNQYQANQHGNQEQANQRGSQEQANQRGDQEQTNQRGNREHRGRAFVDVFASLGDILDNGPSWGQRGANISSMGQLGVILEPTWGQLGPTWTNLGQLGANLRQHGPT